MTFSLVNEITLISTAAEQTTPNGGGIAVMVLEED